MSFCYSLFFVIEFVNGGDLMFHMQRMRRLEESHARYLLAGTVLFFFINYGVTLKLFLSHPCDL